MKTKLQKKVEKFDTWFDHARMQLSTAYEGLELKDFLDTLEVSTRAQAIISSWVENQRTFHGFKGDPETLTIDLLSKLTPKQIQDSNKKLPVPLPDTGDVINDLCSTLIDNKDLFQYLHSTRDFFSLRDLKKDAKEAKQNIEKIHILEYLDCAVTQIGYRLLFNPKSELMLIEKELAEKVLASNNESISVEDLYHIPFKEMILEFSSPISLCKHEDNEIKAIAVGFYRNFEAGLYSVIWYTDVKLPLKQMIMNARINIAFTSASPDLSRFIMDKEVKLKLGLDYFTYGIEAGMSSSIVYAKDNDKDKVFELNKKLNKVENEIARKSKNLWDFVTCRNIDYETYNRSTKNIKIKKYQHLQGKHHIGPRFFKVLKINKRIKIPEEQQKGTANTRAGFLEHVPGTFHKWVYCNSCGRVHRKDLIGTPCRNSDCKKCVGPMHNIRIEKYWHSDYYRGDGVQKQTIREVIE